MWQKVIEKKVIVIKSKCEKMYWTKSNFGRNVTLNNCYKKVIVTKSYCEKKCFDKK